MTDNVLTRGDQAIPASTANAVPQRLLIAALRALLAYIETHSREQEGFTQTRNAFAVFEQLDQEHQRILAPRLFDVLDRPMKAVGDKRFVSTVAQKCISAVSHPNRLRDEAECEARARICGLSWVYQRTGNLELAANEAQLSLEISKDLSLATNIAFCNKCLGRLSRMRAETAAAKNERDQQLKKSESFLETAITAFGELEEYGEDSAEVGDCCSLLGRTYLVAGNISRAEEMADEAARRIIDQASKDFLDLQILLGESPNSTVGRQCFRAVYNRHRQP